AYTIGETGACEIAGTVQPQIVEDSNACGGTITITADTAVICALSLHDALPITIEPAPAPAFTSTPANTTLECNEAADFVAAAAALAYTNGETGAREIAGTVQPQIVEDWNECGGTITITWDTVVICDHALNHVQV